MRLKLAGALIAALLVFGLVFGVGQAAAASLPGGPLYGLKLTAEQARMELTSNPEAKAELAAELAENRLDEIGRMMAAGKTVDSETAHQAQQSVSQAYNFAHQIKGDEQSLQAQRRLGNMIQNRHRIMALEVNGVAELEQQPVRALLRSMVRVRTALQTEEGQLSGQQTQQRLGEDPLFEPVPPDPATQPGPGPQAGQDSGVLDAAGETGSGGQGQGPMDPASGGSQGQGPGGSQPEGAPGEPPPSDGDGYGPGPNIDGTVDGPMGPNYDEAPTYGPGYGAPSQNKGSTQPGINWPWEPLNKQPKSGGKK
jgi:hypothetical protein